ncbi:sigma-54 interaction domain-containing protein [Acidiphilium iwatense]|uniref:Sigma-54 dependent transcriptional regulator n=1 Tax=Acidiphilium iwatense TaxID=768198 RepID=A0ABS9DRP3_9PROT|nr:sigma-54 dependent transcriptional regulator [Acidiphilium iwatense]MCF3945352.1 sigma-54 dependent transcriptional regulator [Acidiphilium iwatense]
MISQKSLKIIGGGRFSHNVSEPSRNHVEPGGRNDADGNGILHDRSRSVADAAKLATALAAPREDRFVVGTSPAMRKLFVTIRKFACADAPVLIVGETGTGKELVANAIHQKSTRASGPFKAVNCAAIPPTLIASELFGYEKGAFTGAVGRKTGIVEAAKGGTLFLDEIGHLPSDLQGYMLRFLQEKTIQRVGGISQIPVDVRIIAASNVNFDDVIAVGAFRADLFYRLNVLTVHLPPLRERPEDIELLARFFLGRFAAEAGKTLTGFAPQAIERLCSHCWPGNVRELMACIQRAVVITDADRIAVDDLDLSDHPSAMPKQVIAPRVPKRRQNAGTQREALIDAIDRCGGNLTQVAAALGITRVSIYRMVRKFGLVDRVAASRQEGHAPPEAGP